MFERAGSADSAAWHSPSSLNAIDGLKNVFQVIMQPFPAETHTGTASASTAARNFSGNALGVRTSTGTPSS
jgi:hypothetical protein